MASVYVPSPDSLLPPSLSACLQACLTFAPAEQVVDLRIDFEYGDLWKAWTKQQAKECVAGLRCLPALKHLKLGSPGFLQCPEAIGKLTQLKTLGLKYNNLGSNARRCDCQ